MRLIVCVAALAALGAGLGSAAAANKKLVEGTVYDTTCAGTTCEPECPPPPHCGPITARPDARIACPLRERRIVACPLSAVVAPIYAGEGAVVKVRRRGSSTPLATLPVTEGHFKIRLAAGEYVLHPYLPEEKCWTGEAVRIEVSAHAKGPVAATISVENSCAS